MTNHRGLYILSALALILGAGREVLAADCNANGVPDSVEIAPRFASHVIDGQAHGASAVHPADLDGDGDPDVLWGASYDHLIAWSKNLDGHGTFGPRIPLAGVTALTAPSAAIATDPDHDGDLDIAYGWINGVAWKESLGAGQFEPGVHNDDPFGARSLAAGDFNGDGNSDFAVCSFYENSLTWYGGGEGAGLYGSGHGIATTTLHQPTSVFAADLDGNNTIDLLVASQQNDSVSWYRGNGFGTFADMGSLLIGAAHGPRSVFAADLDGDGDRDVLVASFHDGRVTWLRNNGVGLFTEVGTIIDSPTNAQSVAAVDLDGDGDRDIVVALVTAATGPGTHSDCCEPTDGTPYPYGCDEWQCMQNIVWIDSYCYDVEWDQICADEALADPDCAIGCGGGPGRIQWFENVDGAGTFGPPRVVSNDEQGTWALASADIDRDGDADLLSAAFVSDRVSWHENQMRDCNNNHVPDDCDIAGAVAVDCNANGVPDSCELAAGVTVDPDADGVCGGDCAPENGQAWSSPSPARTLLLAKTGGPTLLTWQAPAIPGGSTNSYDVLRSPAASDFFSGTLCLEADGPDLSAEDGDSPAPGGVFHYLIRAQNACPLEGNLGAASDGTPHTGVACP